MVTDPFHLTLTGWRGSPVVWSVIVSNPNEETPTLPGTPIDVSGWVTMFTVKRSYDDTDAQAVYKRDKLWPTGSTDGALNGELPAAITDDLFPSSYPFDVRVIKVTGGEPEMLLTGTIEIQQTVGTRQVPDLS